jgi:thiol-disulfide isomerase/thioredoxin
MHRFILAAWLSLLGTHCLAQRDPPADVVTNEVPRYRFRLGQELHYVQYPDENLFPKSPNQEEANERYEHPHQWWIWVTRENDNGHCRLLIRKQVKNVLARPGSQPQAYFENDFFGYCDVLPDGSFEVNASLGGNAYFKTHPDEIVVHLPPDLRALRNGWSYASPIEDAQHTLRVSNRHRDVLEITARVVRPEDRVQDYSVTRRFEFDMKRGLLVRIVDEYESKQPHHPFYVRRPIGLVSNENRSPGWISALANEVDEYISVQSEFEQAVENAGQARSKAECKRILDIPRERIAALRAKSKITEVKAVLDASLKLHDRDIENEVKNATEREALYAQPPINWEGTDFNGRTHRQADYHGKVVVLDFWYSGCVHCVRALPTINKLAAHYENKDVVVLGVNKDQDENDARRVITSSELNYPNLRGDEISKKYRVNEWPTFIVLDQTGRIANYHAGNTDDLYKLVLDMVDQLLERGPVAK